MYLRKEHFIDILSKNDIKYPENVEHFERFSNNSCLFSSGDSIYIIYINTIIFIKENNKITLNSDGWRTNTTKKLINKGFDITYKPYTLYQKDFKWYLKINEEVKEFRDNITL